MDEANGDLTGRAEAYADEMAVTRHARVADDLFDQAIRYRDTTQVAYAMRLRAHYERRNKRR